MRAKLFKQLKAIAEEIKDDSNSQLFKHFDLWNENIIHIEEEQPFYTPALFVEFLPIKWETLPGMNREAVIRFKLHILATISSPITTQPPHSGYTALDALMLSDRLFAGMHKSLAQNTYDDIVIDTLTMEASELEHDFDEFLLQSDTYSCHVTDINKKHHSQTNNISPNLKLQLKKP